MPRIRLHQNIQILKRKFSGRVRQYLGKPDRNQCATSGSSPLPYEEQTFHLGPVRDSSQEFDLEGRLLDYEKELECLINIIRKAGENEECELDEMAKIIGALDHLVEKTAQVKAEAIQAARKILRQEERMKSPVMGGDHEKVRPNTSPRSAQTS